jgi:GNAT superfamily N-acetyltransferase
MPPSWHSTRERRCRTPPPLARVPASGWSSRIHACGPAGRLPRVRGAHRVPRSALPLPSLYVIVRDALADEAQAVAGCYEWLFEAPGMRPPQWDRGVAVARLREAVESDRSAVLVADVDSQIIGVCTVYLDIVSVRFGQRCWIEDLAVDPEWRSRGAGAKLMDAAEQWARDRGASHLELDSAEVRERAHRFYERRRPTWTSRCFGWTLT